MHNILHSQQTKGYVGFVAGLFLLASHLLTSKYEGEAILLVILLLILLSTKMF